MNILCVSHRTKSAWWKRQHESQPHINSTTPFGQHLFCCRPCRLFARHFVCCWRTWWGYLKAASLCNTVLIIILLAYMMEQQLLLLLLVPLRLRPRTPAWNSILISIIFLLWHVGNWSFLFKQSYRNICICFVFFILTDAVYLVPVVQATGSVCFLHVNPFFVIYLCYCSCNVQVINNDNYRTTVMC